MLCLLVASESRVEGALIDSLPKAVWYSLVTLTTVGYGDLYPVTALGRAIGVLFLLLSTGLLALLIGIAISAITGHLMPRARLWRRRRRRWYVFSADNEAARALSAHFSDGLVVFCHGSIGREGGLNVRMSPRELFDLPYAEAGERLFFAIDEDEMANECAARALASRAIRIYCRGDGLDEDLPPNVSRFSEYECCARQYWQARPWNTAGERVAVLGSGRHAQALVAQGLLTAPPDCALQLLGDWDAWIGMHPALFELPETVVSLAFCGADWHDQAQILRDADRIIICSDQPADNREALIRMSMYYVNRGNIDVLCPPGLQKAYWFGGAEALFTPELVMKQAQSRRAKELHEIYRRGVDYPVPEWDALSDFLKRSNLAAADHLLTKIRLLLPEMDVHEVDRETCALAAGRFEALPDEARERCRFIEHERWMLFYALYNWRYAERRDNAMREHPLIVRYDALSPEEREKDDNAWRLLFTLSNEETA